MQPSFLDRLTESDTDGSFDRDLTALLNTRRQERAMDPAFEQASNSVLTFGVEDFTSYNLNSGVDQEYVRRSIERAIRQFEPRLTRAVVSLRQPEPFHPLLSLHVEAELQTGDGAEPVAMEGMLDRASRRIAIRRAR